MWIDNARLILPAEVLERGALRIEDGKIADIREHAPAKAFNARGMTLLPGLVDLHGDMIERELEPRPGTRFDHDLALFELDKRLASCGVTTAYAFISPSPCSAFSNSSTLTLPASASDCPLCRSAQPLRWEGVRE